VDKQAESQASPMVGDLSVSDDLSLGSIDFDLNPPDIQTQPEPFDATPDFSPEGTLVMPSVMDDAVATFIGFDEAPDTTSSDEKPLSEPELAVDFDLDFSSSAAQTVLSGVGDFSQNDILAQEIPSEDSPEYDNPKLADTVVNAAVLDDDSLDFDVKLTDSVFLGQPMTPPEFDIGSINLDLAAEPIVNSPVVESVPVADSSAPVVAEAPVDSAHWEEVNTKLDLAKAYEEMGDLEGARELLEEVVGEGPVDLVEQARAILARIGE
jgi:pilus assembly protein FimV